MQGSVQLRVARPTDKLEEVTRFYTEAVGFEQLGSFEGHAGYDGVMLGTPGGTYHLEFTHHVDGSPCPAPTRDNLLVFYYAETGKYREAVQQMQKAGEKSVEPENPYWENISTTFQDPDGWRVVFVDGVFP